MPRISKVSWPKMGLEYGFMFDLRSEDELRSYWMNCRKGSLTEGLNDYMKAAAGKGHCTTPNGSLLQAAVLVEELKDERRSVVQVWCDIQDEVFCAMRSAIRQFGSIFINRNGGYFGPLDGFKVTETEDIAAWALPGSKITVTKWPNGTHWYARVGGQDVEMYGRRKWDTREEAEKLARRWAKEHGVFAE